MVLSISSLLLKTLRGAIGARRARAAVVAEVGEGEERWGFDGWRLVVEYRLTGEGRALLTSRSNERRRWECGIRGDTPASRN